MVVLLPEKNRMYIQMDIIDMSKWHTCQWCVSDSYIIDDIPSTHYAFRQFKTRSTRIFEEHNRSEGHVKHFKKFYCEPCDKQCYFVKEFKSHCETIRHKHQCNITMNCEVCKYSTSDKSNYERHMFTLKHQNAVNGVVKKKEDYVCEPCNFKTKYESKLKEHQETQKHQDLINGTQIKKGPCVCELCNFKALSRSAMLIHEQSKKHQKVLNKSTDVSTSDHPHA